MFRRSWIPQANRYTSSLLAVVSGNDSNHAVLSVNIHFVRECKHYKDTVETPGGITVDYGTCSKTVCVPPIYVSAAPREALTPKLDLSAT